MGVPLEVIIAIISGAGSAGLFTFALKAWMKSEIDLRSSRLKELWKTELDLEASRQKEWDKLQINKRIEILGRQLSEFYWPVYLRLQRDNAVWDRIMDATQSD